MSDWTLLVFVGNGEEIAAHANERDQNYDDGDPGNDLCHVLQSEKVKETKRVVISGRKFTYAMNTDPKVQIAMTLEAIPMSAI